jgi:hypothetical protein
MIMTLFETASNSVVAMVDFDNIYPHHIQEEDLSSLTHDINTLIESALSMCQDASSILIRFYGGWFEEALPTPISNKLQLIIGSAPFFPLPHPKIKGKLLRGQIDLAKNLIHLPNIEWLHTKRTRQGLPRIRLTKDHLQQGCIKDSQQCPAKTLYKFTKSKKTTCPVENCLHTNASIFRSSEQKMVDTMLACDLLSSVPNPECAGVILCTSDTDLLPPLALAATYARGKPIKVLGDYSSSHAQYLERLGHMGITFEPWRKQA